MPRTTVFVYAEEDVESPVLDWLEELRSVNVPALVAEPVCSCRPQIGHELRRPCADLLRDGIYELRARVGHVNCRLLYFSQDKDIDVLPHGLTKEREISAADIERAIERKRRYEQDPEKHRAQADPQDL